MIVQLRSQVAAFFITLGRPISGRAPARSRSCAAAEQAPPGGSGRGLAVDVLQARDALVGVRVVPRESSEYEYACTTDRVLTIEILALRCTCPVPAPLICS